MRFHHLLQLSDDELLEKVVASIRKNNPRIKIGERITTPTTLVWGGKIYKDPLIELRPITLNKAVPHVPPKKEVVTTKSVMLKFSEVAGLEFASFDGKYLHPYRVEVPHREWMTSLQPGAEIMAMDDSQFQASPYTLTEQDFIDHEYLIFRFAPAYDKCSSYY